jgi:site-specific recombinase XerC
MADRYQPGSLHYWQAKYERQLLAVLRRRSARRACIALENCLCRFKDRKTPDEIYVMDITDYKVAREREGIGQKTIDYELGVLRAFYNWLIEVQDVPTFNPVSKPKKHVSLIRF